MLVSSVQEYFDTLPQRFQAAASKGVNAVFQFELGGDGGGTYHVLVNDGTMSVQTGPHAAPTATIKMNAADYVKMANGQLNGMQAYMKGQMKVTGNLLLAQKMQGIFPAGKG
jgi:putative sterol carrier protein